MSDANTGGHPLQGATADQCIAIVGDVFLGGQLTGHTSIDRVVQSTSYWGAGSRLLNLESPITDGGVPAKKGVLSVGSSALRTLRALNPTAVGLANNHIHDMGSRGISETQRHLDELDIGHTGAGSNADEAARPRWITDSLCLLAYCHFDAPTLRQVQAATPTESGMNPLILEDIERTLGELPERTRAILYLHWGEEHLLFPTPYQIAMARRLLDNPRVALIVGAHAHRVQGYLERRGKRAYFCLGNFLFPNFVILPPTNASSNYDLPPSAPVTRRYHRVTKPTVKKWQLINRLSLLVSYDAQSGSVRHVPHLQLDDLPLVRELEPPFRQLFGGWVWLLSRLLELPTPLYRPLHWINVVLTRTCWRLSVLLFMARQNGLHWVATRIHARLLRKS